MMYVCFRSFSEKLLIVRFMISEKDTNTLKCVTDINRI